MRKRNPVREWRHALGRKGAANARAWTPVAPHLPDDDVAVAPGDLPSWLRRTRGATTAPRISEQSAETIRVLQRGNTLLRLRFGIDWADAAAVIFAESERRGASPVALARVLTAGLRRDARERTS